MVFGDYRTVRRVLRNYPAEADVEELSRKRDWHRIGIKNRDPDSGTNYEVMWLTDEALTLHYVEDEVARHAFVFFMGRDVEVADSYDRATLDGLDFWTLGETIAAMNQATEGPDRALSLLRMGLAAPYEFNEAVFSRVETALQDDIPEMRLAATWAASYAPYAQYRPLLRRVADEDSSADVRQLAIATLRAFDEAGA
jgi:hypothetical protein